MQRLENEAGLIATRRSSQYMERSYGETRRDIKFYIKL